jgi:hypothetical protein
VPLRHPAAARVALPFGARLSAALPFAALPFAALLSGALLFGAADGLLAGNTPGLHAGVANLSAPWLLVALLPASPTRSPARGALTGFACTMLALVGFYVAKTVLLAGQNGGGGFLAELGVEVRFNRIYFLAGLVTGPVFGAVGGWLGRRSRRAVWLACGALLTLEIAVVAAVSDRQLLPPPLYFSWAVADWRPYVLQTLAGLAVLTAAFTRPRQPADPA